MSNDQIAQLRKLVTGQLQTVLDLYGKEIQGSDLELQIRLAMASIGGATADAPKEDTATPQRTLRDDMRQALQDDDGDDWEDAEEEEAEPAPVPRGFQDEDAYKEFLRQQAAVLPTEVVMDEETGEERLDVARPDDAVGVIAREDGTFENVGSMEESLEKAKDALQEMNTHVDEYTGEEFQEEVPEVHEIRVKFYAPRVNQLTEEQVVANILGSPVSRPMVEHLGNNYRVENGERENEKIIAFTIDQEDNASRDIAKLLTHGHGLATFGGRQVIPGLGAVTASLVL